MKEKMQNSRLGYMGNDQQIWTYERKLPRGKWSIEIQI